MRHVADGSACYTEVNRDHTFEPPMLHSMTHPVGHSGTGAEGGQPTPAQMSKLLRVLAFSAFYPPAFLGGGPIRTLEAVMHTSPEDVEVAVMTSDRDLGTADRLAVASNRWVTRDGVPVYFASADKPLQLCRSWWAARAWRPDVIYVNSFFSPEFSIAVQLLSRLGWWRGALLVVEPCGQMNPGALGIKSRRKKIYCALYRRSGMLARVLWHASSDVERANIREVFDTSDVIVREDETLLPKRPVPPSVPANGPLRAVFLARISRIKGLDIVLRALCSSRQHVILDVFGPPEDSLYLDECKAIAALVPASVTVNFLGTVKASEVMRVLNGHEVMLLPTDGENFGHAIAEALSASCPVMCTPFTPWTDRLQSGGGVVVPSRDVNDWSVALDNYASLPGDVRNERRTNAGAAYVRWQAEEKGPHVFELFPEQLHHPRTRKRTWHFMRHLNKLRRWK